MEMEKVKRFITITTPSVKSTEDKPSLVTKMTTIMAKLFFPSAYKEIVQVGEVVKLSHWIGPLYDLLHQPKAGEFLVLILQISY